MKSEAASQQNTPREETKENCFDIVNMKCLGKDETLEQRMYMKRMYIKRGQGQHFYKVFILTSKGGRNCSNNAEIRFTVLYNEEKKTKHYHLLSLLL